MSQCRIASVLVACMALGVAGSAGGEVRVWAVDDMVRIDPQTGSAFEANPTVLRGGVDATVVSAVRRQPGTIAVARAGVQPGQLPTSGGAAAECGALDADHAAGQADQDRR